jgi:zinc transport system permease protein
MEMSSLCQKKSIIRSRQFPLTDTITFGLIVGVFVGSTAGYLGSIMVSKHMALVGDALSHVALPGLALGILFNFNPFIGAFTFLAATVIVTWYLQKSTTLSVEAIIGVLFVLALAIGILITPEVDLLEALFGDVSKITLTDTIITVLVSIAVIFVTKAIYQKLAVSMISKELAIASRIKVERINLIYLFLVAIIVALGIKEVGTLLVGALVIVPAAAAKNISSTLTRYSLMSAIFGLASATSGVILSSYVNLPAGPLVVIVGAVIFAGVVVVSSLSKRLANQKSIRSTSTAIGTPKK